MSGRIYLSSPDVGVAEEEALVRAIRSGWVAPLGPEVDAFERDLAARVGVAHGVALNSGTAALHLGLLTLGVQPGDVVITATLTFAATANAIVYVGAEPFFVDAELGTGNLDPELLVKALVSLTTAGERVAAIVPVDLLGKAVDYTAIERIAECFGVPVLADAAESLGATHRGKAVGSFGRASILSFNGSKIITTSGGGAQTGAQAVIVAIARADAALLRRVKDACRPLGLEMKVVPPLEQILSHGGQLVDVRDVSIEDLIGRQPVDTNVESIAGYLTGKRVLVTGAGGSIGVELCRQIHRFGPAELIMLDRDETGLQTAQFAIRGHGLLDSSEVVLVDIRDAATLEQIFAERRPEVVFHAAALKHLPMLQQYPHEAWKTNVLGTRNVLAAAHAAGVGTFVNISTDKAADPVSVLGYSKRLAERLTAWTGRQAGRPYLSVRFGNVLGRGSMVPLFQQMIEQGGPLTVTHPDVTRYFMTIPEACQLVVQAGGVGKPGEVLILDMGEPVRILDVATRMIEMSGRGIEIVLTGLREGEKLHEVLVAEGETDERPQHPKISHSQVPELSPEELDHEEWLDASMIGAADRVEAMASAVSGGRDQ